MHHSCHTPNQEKNRNGNIERKHNKNLISRYEGITLVHHFDPLNIPRCKQRTPQRCLSGFTALLNIVRARCQGDKPCGSVIHDHGDENKGTIFTGQCPRCYVMICPNRTSSKCIFLFSLFLFFKLLLLPLA